MTARWIGLVFLCNAATSFAAQAPHEIVLTPGVALRVYDIGETMDLLPSLIDGQTPNVSTVIPIIDLRHGDDFGGLHDRFLAEISGYLRVEQPGQYTFRLTSDDGSRLLIDDEVVVDHDGLRGAESREGHGAT